MSQMKTRTIVQRTIAVLFVLTLSVAAAPLWAQNQSQGEGAQQSQGPTLQQQSQSNIEVKDAELKKFAQAMKKIQQIQKDSNKQIEKAFSGSSMSKKRFNELYRARQKQGQSKAEGETSKETKEYKKMVEKIKTIQSDSQQQMMKAVKDQGITVQRFNKIVRAMRQDQELSKRLQEYM
jgi:opacity protein-like surface antigen